MDNDEFTELVHFLQAHVQTKLRTLACQEIPRYLNAENCKILTKSANLDNLIDCSRLCRDENDTLTSALAKNALTVLVNLTSEPSVVDSLTRCDHLFTVLFAHLKDGRESSSVSLSICCLLNMSLSADNAARLFDRLSNDHQLSIKQLVSLANDQSRSGQCERLVQLFENLSQVAAFREQFWVHMHSVIPMIDHPSANRRAGSIGCIRNCCFDIPVEFVDENLITHLILPLAGPMPESWDAEDIDKLPIDLQYLDEHKRREFSEVLRKQLVECLHQLASTRSTRQLMRSLNVYLILRDLFQSETDAKMRLAIENLIDLLIKTEAEIGANDLKTDVKIPADMIDKFEQIDAKYID